jgi:sugar phosphate isomerase/epimerase
MTEERISIVTDEIAQDLDTVARFLDENHMRGIEIRTLGGGRIPLIDDRTWEDLKILARNEGWNILGLSPGIFKSHYKDENKIEEDLEEILPDTIGRAVEIGADFIIAFGFMYDPENPEMEPPGHILGALERAAELCSSAEIKLLLENEPGSFADTGERTERVIEKVAHLNLFANWDPCNSNVFDNAVKLSAGAKTLGGLIRNVHVKDGCQIDGSLYPSYGSISTGHLGWKEHLKTLKEFHYNGWFGIETHFEPLYESSRIMLREFRQLLDEVDFWNE